MQSKDKSKRTCLRCDKPAKQLGLCATHYSQYYKEVKRMTEDQRKEFDARLVDAGLLLPRRRPGPSSNDPYAELASKMFPSEQDRVIQDGKDDIKSALNQYRKKKDQTLRVAESKPNEQKKRGAQ